MRLLLLLIVACAHTLPASAQATAPYRMIVPFPPGGGTDMLARAIAQKLSEAWGQPVIVDNRAGANGTIGAAVAARSPADGRTMLIVPGGFAVNPSIYPNLPFDTEKDFAPVSLLAENAMVIVVHPSFPPRTVKQLVALIRSRPDEINYGSSGVGSPPHLATELFKHMTGTSMNHVPYKGAAAVATDVVAGHIPMYFMATLLAVSHVKSGRLRGLAVTSAKRFDGLPELPTVAEAGVPGYAMTNWYGLTVRAGTPKSAIEKLNAEVVRIVNTSEVKERLTNEGATVIASTADEFGAFLKTEIVKAARIVKAAGITASN